MTDFHLTVACPSDAHHPINLSHQIHDDKPGLLVCYDLNACLKKNRLNIKGYSEILDIYLLESIVYLGKYHRRYFGSEQNVPVYGIRKHLPHYVSVGQGKGAAAYNIHPDFWERLAVYALKLKEQSVREKSWNHYLRTELPFAIHLHVLTWAGVTLDSRKMESFFDRFNSAYQKLTYALDVNNLNGTRLKDLNEWVTGYGFDEYFPADRDVITEGDLALLQDRHQVFSIFLRLEKLKRFKSLLDGIRHQKKMDPTYKTMGAATGRCTSTHPNIMGIPKTFRPVVIPSQPDFGIVECDYSQMEVGVVAALANDRNLIHDFNTMDVYTKTGSFLFGCSDAASRQKAKIIFLGIQYGLSPKTIAKRLERSDSETIEIRDRLFSRYSGLKDYLTGLVQFGQQNGFVTNISGLKRYRNNQKTAANYWEKNWFKNFPVQSSAATVFKQAIVSIGQKLAREPFHLLVPLYDSIVFECPRTRLKEMTGVVVDCMVRSMKDFFPMLEPKVTVNDSDPRCWNSEGKSLEFERFINNPLYGINILEKPSSNVDWSMYL